MLEGLEGLAFAETLRRDRWLYAGVNAAHIFGIALLVGAVWPIALRRLGLWPGIPADAFVRVLTRMAVAGLTLAVAAGLCLFAARAREYAANPAFLIKMGLLAAGLANGALALRGGGRGTAVVSLLVWPAVLVFGRLIAFVE